MDLASGYVDVILHLDRYLGSVIQSYGVWTYAILFLIVFSETGLVIMPFLPGDSLLFAAGAFAAAGAFDVKLLFILLSGASVLGDNLNYWVGRYVGPNILGRERIRFINRRHLERTERYYEEHGPYTIVVARFMPVLRTFAPFVAGIGRMSYPRFLAYSVAGSLLWNTVFVLGGFFFGNIPVVKENFTLAIMLIIVVSFLPAIREFILHRRTKGQ